MRVVSLAIGLIGGADCSRSRVEAALGRECSDGASCYGRAGDLIRKIYEGEGAAKKGSQETSADRAKAVALFQRGCDLGSGPSCHMLGFWLEGGDLATPDLPRAARLHERGCALKEFRSCDSLAMLYQDGRGVPKDPGLQAKYQKLACDLAAPTVKHLFCKHDRVAEAMRDECSDGDSCFRQAQVLMGAFFDVKSKRVPFTPKADEWADRSVVLYQKGCDLGAGQSCGTLCDLFMIGGLAGIDLPRAALLYEKGCALKDSVACDQLAKLYSDGRGVPKNRGLQVKYRKLACAFADPVSREQMCDPTN